MSRIDDYQLFISGNHTDQEYYDKIKSERDGVSTRLLLARLKTATGDYHPYTLGKTLVEGQRLGDLRGATAGVPVRVGWVRWREIREQIDAVDNWLEKPDYPQARQILKEVMVHIPDHIEEESDYLAKLKQAATNTASEALATVGPPLGAIAAGGLILYYWAKRN